MADLFLTLRAERDAEAARDWYDGQLTGLGDDFIDELRDALDLIREGPLHFQVVIEDLRRVLLKRFPYAVFYLVEPQQVVVLGILHQARNPEEWRNL